MRELMFDLQKIQLQDFLSLNTPGDSTLVDYSETRSFGSFSEGLFV
jgi:hypothetical protein